MIIKLTELENGNFNLIINGTTIENLSDKDIRELDQELNLIWYRKDVQNYINEHHIQLTEDSFDDVLNTYAHLRFKNDGDDCGMTWTDCLDEAFCGYKYGNVLTTYMKEKLINAMLDERVEIIAETIECDVNEITNIPRNKLQTKITEFIENLEKDDAQDELIEIYSNWIDDED